MLEFLIEVCHALNVFVHDGGSEGLRRRCWEVLSGVAA